MATNTRRSANKPDENPPTETPETTQPTELPGAAEMAARAERSDAVADGGPVLSDAAGAMVTQQVRSEAGAPFIPPPDVLDAQQEAAEERQEKLDEGQGIVVHAQELHVNGVRLGDDYERVLPQPGPGETERGWSPEVTARHPMLLAETMAELAGDAIDHHGRRGARVEGIDPTNRAALERALSETGFHDVRQTMLINEAIKVNSDRLAAAQEEAAHASPHHGAAMRDAVSNMRRVADSMNPSDS